MVISSSDLMTILNSDSEELKQYKEVGTVEEFKDLKEKEERFDRNIKMFNEIGLEIRNKAIDEFAEKLKYELNGNIIPDNEKFTYARKQQEQICHQNMTLKRAIKYVDYIAEQLKGGAVWG